MNKMYIEEILKATGGKLVRKCDEEFVENIWQDSRDCGPSTMFAAIIGEVQDGHKFIPQVIDAGCRTILVSHEGEWAEYLENSGKEINAIMVDDTEFALGELASYYLKKIGAKVVAITGTVGKTSERDMIYYALSEKFKCGRNLKNYNTLTGLPISIFQFDEDTEVAVLEMGMDRFGEIERLSTIAKPDIAVITNIGFTHMEYLGSQEGIFKAKMEIAQNIKPKAEGGALIFATDDKFLTKERTAGNYKQIGTGLGDNNDYHITSVDDFGMGGIEFTLERNGESKKIKLPVPGAHNAVNASMAIAVAELLGEDIDDAVAGLQKLTLTGRRLKMVKGKTVTIIDDCYNAGPDSVKSAVTVLKQSETEGRRVAILGEMRELGSVSDDEHYAVGKHVTDCGIDKLIALGNLAKPIAQGAIDGGTDAVFFETKEDFYKEMDNLIQDGDLVLVKASRGMHLEDIVEKLEGR